jgi:hypothetical protein
MFKMKILGVLAGLVAVAPFAKAEARIYDFTINFEANAYDPAHVLTFEVDSASSFISADAGGATVSVIDPIIDGADYNSSSYFNGYTGDDVSFYAPNPPVLAGFLPLPGPEFDVYRGPSVYTYIDGVPGFVPGYFSGFVGHYSGVNATMDISSSGAPEPGAWCLMLIGLTVAGVALRRAPRIGLVKQA